MVDWEAIARSKEFRELVRRRRGFVIPATIFFFTYYMVFIIVAGYAPEFMAESVYEGLTVGYCYALTQFLMVFVLGKVGFNPIELFNRAEANTTAESTFSLGPGTYLPKPLDTVSLGLALVLGTAGLPHILMRFFTVPNAKAARSSVVWAIFIIGIFYLLLSLIHI